MTPEELLKAVRDQMTQANGESAVVTIEAIKGFLAQRFGSPVAPHKTPGEQLIEDEQVKDFIKLKMKGTAPVEVHVPRYGLKGGEWSAPIAKTTILMSDFPAERTYLPPAEFPMRANRLRDFIPVAGLATPQIEYARIIGFTNSAGGVAEGSAKPEGAIDTELIVDSVKQLAVFIPVSRQVLRDVPGLAPYINQVLEYFLQLEEDDQILNGTGGNDMTGILQTTGTLTQAFSADIIETVRKAITVLQTGFTSSGFDPTLLVLNPKDWEEAELTKDLNDRYLLIPDSATPAQGGPQPPRLWRVPVVVTPAIAENSALLGNFSIGCTLWTYDPVSIRLAEQHSDWFTKNLVAVLAEFRELLAVYFPKAFVEIALT